MEWWNIVWPILLPLVVSYLFNQLVGLPKKFKDAKQAEKEENLKRDERINKLEEVVNKLPEYRAQSKAIQKELQETDTEIKNICQKIRNDIRDNREALVGKLNRLEDREKNALRSKIIAEYRLYTDEVRNPQAAWSEMEAHSFWKLVEDYEGLGGNDYVHNTVIPAMHELNVIKMDDLVGLKALYASRKV